MRPGMHEQTSRGRHRDINSDRSGQGRSRCARGQNDIVGGNTCGSGGDTSNGAAFFHERSHQCVRLELSASPSGVLEKNLRGQARFGRPLLRDVQSKGRRVREVRFDAPRLGAIDAPDAITQPLCSRA